MAVQAPATILFSLFFMVFCTGFLCQFREFRGAGLSPEAFLSIGDWLGSEEIRFVRYHMKRTAGTLVLHSLLPIAYFLGYSYLSVVMDHSHPSMASFWEESPWFFQFTLISLLLPITALTLLWYWSLNGWSKHPFTSSLLPYNSSWTSLAADIETEFRRIDKICLQTSPVRKVVVTDNWVLTVGAWPWSLHISHQSDVSLSILSSDHHQISTEGERGGTQYLSIEVLNRRSDVPSFSFRLNSLEYQNLQDKVSGTIENVRNVQVYKTVSERFVDVFKEQVAQNPTAEHQEPVEPCIGCMAQPSNVKLQRVCPSSSGPVPAGADPPSDSCVNCYCRPMWCVDCMAKWFASRQDQTNPETWLGSRCPCPTCRSKFCVLDVCLLAP